MKRRDFIKNLPLLPIVIAGVIMGRDAEAKEAVCKHEPLILNSSDYAWLTWCRDDMHGDDWTVDIQICKHCGLLYGADLSELYAALD